LSPNKALELKVVDAVIQEPVGGAHRYPADAIKRVKDTLIRELDALGKKPIEQVLNDRFDKFRRAGNTTLLDEKDGE